MCYAPHSLRIRSAPSPPEGKAIFIALFTWLPLACIKFCLQNFLQQKLSATSWLPLGGKLSQKATDEGRNLFSDTNNLNAALRGFPLGGGSAR